MIRRLRAVLAPLFYCVVASTTLRLVIRYVAPVIALTTLLAAPPASRAQEVGLYEVASCQADQKDYNVRAFTHFAHRGMKIRYACRPNGPGVRGVVTQNVARKGRVKRNSVAQVTITAPAGTEMMRITWEGRLHREDCRYALQLWADGPGGNPIPIAHKKANRECPRPRRAQAAQVVQKTYSIPGATKVTQRVICVGSRRQNWCSARGTNYIKTQTATIAFKDAQPPTVAIQQDTPLTQGAWVSGPQVINYTAADNVGVHYVRAFLDSEEAALHTRDCLVLAPTGPFTALQPCPDGPGQLVIRTHHRLAEGSQQLIVEAEDPAGNRTVSTPVTARVDTTPPPRVDVNVEGGTDWRATNAWVAVWSNPDEGDRAPITAVTYRVCAARGSLCSRGTQADSGIARLPLTVPGAGEWTLSLWRRDAAGNENEEHASVAVPLRYDPDPPQLSFEAQDPADPTLITVRGTDELSGLAGGTIEIAPSTSGVWQALATEMVGSRLLARIDDSGLAAGAYLLRARARDRAGNETTVDRRGDGQPMVVTLPLRRPPTIKAGFERVVRESGKRGRRIVGLRQTARVEFGERVRIAGRLADNDGSAIADAAVHLLTTTREGREELVETLRTNTDGRFHTFATGVHTRTLRLVYSGSPQALPGQYTLAMRVPASTSARASRYRLRNGQAVTFNGRVRGLPVPANGKLVEIQVRFTDRWQTFRTTRSDALGRWSSRYRFQRTRGVQRYRFRIRLPKEAGYPFETSVSRTLAVQVSGT